MDEPVYFFGPLSYRFFVNPSGHLRVYKRFHGGIL